MYSVKALPNFHKKQSDLYHVICISHLWSDANIKMKCKIPSAKLQLYKGKTKTQKTSVTLFIRVKCVVRGKKKQPVIELNAYVQETIKTHIAHNRHKFLVEECQIMAVLVSSIV